MSAFALPDVVLHTPPDPSAVAGDLACGDGTRPAREVETDSDAARPRRLEKTQADYHSQVVVHRIPDPHSARGPPPVRNCPDHRTAPAHRIPPPTDVAAVGRGGGYCENNRRLRSCCYCHE